MNKMSTIRCVNCFALFYKFTNSCREMFIGTSNCHLRKHSIQTGKLLKELPNVHRNSFNSFDFTSNSKFIVTVGDDCLVKVWDYEMRIVAIQGSCQLFIGHSNPINCVQFS